MSKRIFVPRSHSIGAPVPLLAAYPPKKRVYEQSGGTITEQDLSFNTLINPDTLSIRNGETLGGFDARKAAVRERNAREQQRRRDIVQNLNNIIDASHQAGAPLNDVTIRELIRQINKMEEDEE